MDLQDHPSTTKLVYLKGRKQNGKEEKQWVGIQNASSS